MTVIVGSGQGGEKKKRLLLIVGVVGVILLAGGAGVGLRLLQGDDSGSDRTPQQGTRMPAAIDEIQELRAQGYSDSASAKIDEALENPDTSNKDRYLLYIQQGNVLYDKQDYAGAIASYLKAEQIDDTFEVTNLLGNTYRDAGDKAKAIEYYKKAIPLIPASPLQDDEKKSLEAEIARLESQP